MDAPKPDSKPRKRKWDVAVPSQAPPLPTHVPPPPPPADADTKTTPAIDPAARVAEAANRLNAILASKLAKPGLGMAPKEEAFVKEIEINQCPASVRYILTKGATHQEIQQATGATVIAKGRYKAPNDTSAERPLYLRVCASTQEQLNAGVERIEQIMKPSSEQSRAGPLFTERLPLGIDPKEMAAATPHFNFIGKIIGPKGAYVKHIEAHTHAKVQLRGRPNPSDPSRPAGPGAQAGEDEELHLFISAQSQQALNDARRLAQDLLNHVRQEFQEFQKAPPPPHPHYRPPLPPPPVGAPSPPGPAPMPAYARPGMMPLGPAPTMAGPPMYGPGMYPPGPPPPHGPYPFPPYPHTVPPPGAYPYPPPHVLAPYPPAPPPVGQYPFAYAYPGSTPAPTAPTPAPTATQPNSSEEHDQIQGNDQNSEAPPAQPRRRFQEYPTKRPRESPQENGDSTEATTAPPSTTSATASSTNGKPCASPAAASAGTSSTTSLASPPPPSTKSVPFWAVGTQDASQGPLLQEDQTGAQQKNYDDLLRELGLRQ